MNNLINDIIKPETETERLIISDANFIKGAMYGEIRRGHPEGKVIYHIQDVLANVNKYADNAYEREQLRLIAIVHDTFKYKVDRSQPKTGKNHHGYIAKEFLGQYIDDVNLLKIVELHDEASNAYRIGEKRGDWNYVNKRANRLITGLLIEGIDGLYLKFYQCDNETGDKTQDCIQWFKALITGEYEAKYPI